MDKICILGGTFNPIHKGHIALAVQAYEQFVFDKILVMPSGIPAHKEHSDLISAKHRCNMVNIAIAPYPYMELSAIEIERGGNTYTADTLAQLLADKPDLDIYFIIGADSLFQITDWYKPDYIMKHCHLLAANRSRHSNEELNNQRNFLIKHYNAKIDFLNTKDLPYSSTDIRNLVKNDKAITDMVPNGIADYILENHLYKI